MEEKTKIILFFRNNLEFCKDILNLHYYKTKYYFESSEMSHFGKRGISSELSIAFMTIVNVKSARIVNGQYVFENESDTISGLPESVNFPILFNLMIKHGYGCSNINDMFELFYKSNEAQLINLCERFKNLRISIVKELFEFINREECNSRKLWTINNLERQGLNYILLALNENVWSTVFAAYMDDELISKIINQSYQYE